MDYIANKKKQQQQMLEILGISHIDELFSLIPENLRAKPPQEEDGLSEYEGLRRLEEIAGYNHAHLQTSYLGAGAYEHYVPAIVDAICQKSEFLTAYTPYQAEISQGMLQAIFEFQSAICALTGLDAANASLYDGASACAEAVKMALRIQRGRHQVILAESLHPHYRAVVDQYFGEGDVQVITAPVDDFGRLDIKKTEALITPATAAILVQSPNIFGILEEVKALASQAKKQGALTLLCANPLAYGLFASAEEQGADIAIGDCQPLGLPLNFGGPYVGYIACKKALIRQMPGRLIGETVDSEGKRGYVLTLQAREQHIRRGKATSNICTNQGLAALGCLVAMVWYGQEGVKDLARTNYQRAAYLREELGKIDAVKVSAGPHFNEFTIELPVSAQSVVDHFLKEKIAAGIPLSRFFSGRDNQLLIAVTETKSQEQLDRYVQLMREVLRA